MEQPFTYALLTLKNKNISVVNSVGSSHTTIDQSIFPCPQVGYLQFCVLLPTVPCLWQDPLSEATDPRALLSKMNKTRIKMSGAHFKHSQSLLWSVDQLCMGTPTLHLQTSENRTYMRLGGQQPDLNVKPRSRKQRRGRLLTSSRDRLSMPALDSWSLSPVLQSVPYMKYNHVLRSAYIPHILIFEN